MNKLQKSVLLATTALSLAAPVTVVRAADSIVAAGQDQVETVVVTAQRREQRLQDVPISITVFNQQQLSNHNVVNAMDLAKYTPSLSVNSNFGSQNTSFAIRGFVQDIGTAPSVGVFFADVLEPHAPSQGIQVGDGAGPGDFFDLQNVQVLKGPQGTLFGRNTTGGDILVVPQKPTDEFGGYVQGSFGNYNMRGGQGVINIPVNDSIRIRLGVDHESRDGYLVNDSGLGPKDFDDVDYTALRGSIDIDLTPDLENYTIATYSNSDTNGDFQKMIGCDAAAGLGQVGACAQLLPKSPNFQGAGFFDGTQPLADAYQKQTAWRVINNTTWRESDNLTIKNIASYSQIQFNASNPLFGVNLSDSLVTSALPKLPTMSLTEVTPYPGKPFADQANYSEEMQVQGNALDNRLIYQAGAYLQGDTPLSVTGADSANAASCPNLSAFECWDPLAYIGAGALPPNGHHGSVNVTTGETWDNDYALYTQETYKITDELSVTGGYRYTWDREANTSFQTTNFANYPFVPAQAAALIGLPAGTPLPAGIAGSNCTNPNAPGYIPPQISPVNTLLGYKGNGGVPAGACISHYYQRSNAPTWVLESDYKPNDDVMIYAKWARGYRQGVISANITAPYNTASPEKDDDYEVGAKTSWSYGDMSGTFDIDGFYNDFRNQQLLIGFIPNPSYPPYRSFGNCASATPGPGCSSPVSPTAVPINAGKSVMDGVEVDASIVPYTGLSFQVGYTYLNAVVLQAKNVVAPAGGLYEVSGGISPGDEIELSPKNKIALTGAYILPVDDSIGKITISSTFTHTASQVTNYIDRQLPYFTALGIDGRIQPTNLLDLNLNWEQIMGKPLDLSIFATNVTNDRYYTWVPGVAQFAGLETASVGEPQMYGLRVTIHFGEN